MAAAAPEPVQSVGQAPVPRKAWADVPVEVASRVATIAKDTETVKNFLKSKNDLSEVYSPPRIVKVAQERQA